MTPAQIQSVINSIHAEIDRCAHDGDRRAASMLLTTVRRLESYMPTEAPEPPVEAVEAVEPPSTHVAVDRGGKPLKKDKKPKKPWAKPKGV